MKLPKSWITVTPLSRKIALALFIALPFIGFYLGTKQITNITSSTFQPNPGYQHSNTQKLATYENSDYNFQIKFPSNFILSDRMMPSDSADDLGYIFSVDGIISKTTTPGSDGRYFNINVFKPKSEITLAQFVAKNCRTQFAQCPPVATDVKFQDLPAIRTSVSTNVQGPSERITFRKNKYFYMIAVAGNDGINSHNPFTIDSSTIDLYNLIISNFSFIN